MDPWVNSLVQSPLVRSLNTVPSRMSSFAHGVKDNVPPFSFSKVVINPPSTSSVLPWDPASYSVTADRTSEPVRFDIPQYGLLDRAYLLVRAVRKTGAAGATALVGRVPPGSRATSTAADGTLTAYTGASSGNVSIIDFTTRTYGDVHATPVSSSLNFADAISTIELSTNGRTVETLYPASIASEVQKMPANHRLFYEKTLCGFNANATQPKFSSLWDPASEQYYATCTEDPTINQVAVTYRALIAADRTHSAHVDFLIPLPFSMVKQLKDNYQTRFVEPLSITVTPKAMVHVHDRMTADVANTTGFDGYRMSLVCSFHNFHDVIENSIRDQNYKRGFPASIYGYNFNASARVASAAVADKLTVDLIGKELIDTILVLIKRRDPKAAGVMSYSPITAATPSMNFRFQLIGSGRELWSAQDIELLGPDSEDFELADGHPYGEDLSQRLRDQPTYEPVVSFAADTTTGTSQVLSVNYLSYRQKAVSLGFSHALYALKLGMQANQNFYTGGLALQTIANPQLIIQAIPSSGTAAEAVTFWSNYTVDVVLRYSQMIRIDSDTGVITTSLTS